MNILCNPQGNPEQYIVLKKLREHLSIFLTLTFVTFGGILNPVFKGLRIIVSSERYYIILPS